MIGELGLDGRVRPVRGILPAVLAAADAGYEQVVVPECAAAEASLVPGVSVLGVRSLRQLIAVLTDEPVPDEEPDDAGPPGSAARGLRVPGTGAATGIHSMGAAQPDHGHDLADVVGQIVGAYGRGGRRGRWASPVPGGTARRRQDDARGAAARHPAPARPGGVAGGHGRALGGGVLPPGKPLIDVAPYCAPHHSATMQALVGGGPGVARPGAVSLAHRGVLFLDETPEFSSQALDALRQPLEAGHVVIARSAGVVRFPARFLMVLAANPCPCGRFSPAATAAASARPRRSGATRRGCPGRCSTGSTCGSRWTGSPAAELTERGARGESTATVADRVRGGPGAGRRRGSPARPGGPTARCPGRELRSRWHAAPAPWTRRSGTWNGACSPPAVSTGSCASPGPSPTSSATTGPTRRTSPWRSNCAPGCPRACPMAIGALT